MDTLFALLTGLGALFVVALLVLLIGIYVLWFVMAVVIPAGFIFLGAWIGGTGGTILILLGIACALIGWRETMKEVRRRR